MKKRWLQKNAFVLAAVVLLISTLVPGITAVGAQEYSSDGYMYTVRIFSGAQGTFEDGADVITIRAVYNSTIDLDEKLENIQMKKVENLSGELVESKYYAKGIRESGRDNAEVKKTITVIKDADYVVAYAMKGGDVAYTVKYIDADTGNELLPSESYYGNIGEKPVVAYKYIDGYIPKAYNLTKTLREDEQQNTFVFEYKKGSRTHYYYYTEDGGIIYVDRNGETIVDHIPGNTVFIEGAPGGITVIPGETITEGPEVVEGDNGNNGNNGNNGGNNAAGGAADANEAGDAGFEGPVDLIDLDDEPVPLSDSPFGIDKIFGDDEEGSLRVKTALMILPIALMLVLCAAAAVICMRKTRKKEK